MRRKKREDLLVEEAELLVAPRPSPLASEGERITDQIRAMHRQAAKISFMRGWMLAKRLLPGDSLKDINPKEYAGIEALAESHCDELNL